MAAGAATPHHARMRRDVRGARIEGRFTTTPVYSERFRCRFVPGGESESRSQPGVRRIKSATLFMTRMALRAKGIDPPKASDRVEVTHNGQTILYEIQGEPKVIQKRRTVIAYLASIQKVRDSEPANEAP